MESFMEIREWLISHKHPRLAFIIKLFPPYWAEVFFSKQLGHYFEKSET